MVIYRMTFPDGKYYIGLTKQKLSERLSGHKTSVKRNLHLPIVKAINEYGFDSIIVEIIDTADNYDKLLELEKYYIKKFNTKVPNGYNSTEGGQGCLGLKNRLGFKVTDKTKALLSEVNSYKKCPLIVYNTMTKEVLEFESKAEAARQLGVKYNYLKIHCRHGIARKGLLFFDKHNFDIKKAEAYVRKTSSNSVIFKITNGTDTLEMVSMESARRYLNLSSRKIRQLFYEFKTIKGWSRVLHT